LDHKAVDLAIVRVYDNDKLVRSVASSRNGHYSLLLNKGSYKLLAQKTNYSFSPPISINIKGALETVNTVLYMRPEHID